MAGGMCGMGVAYMAEGACVAEGMYGKGGMCGGEGACVSEGMHGSGHVWLTGASVHGRRDGYCSGRYAPYWNAFLLLSVSIHKMHSS